MSKMYRKHYDSLTPEWQDYEQQVQALEAEGLTRSDAQGVVDAEDLKIGRDRTVGMVRPGGRASADLITSKEDE